MPRLSLLCLLAFPAFAQVVESPGVTVEPGATILHRSSILVPSGVTETGTVVVESTVNAKGEVTDARVVSGPEELRNAALSSVLQWHFSPDASLPPTIQSTIRFSGNAQTAAPPTQLWASNTVLKSIVMTGLPDDLADKVRASLSVKEGDTLSDTDVARIQTTVKSVDEHLQAMFVNLGSGTTLMIQLPRTQGGVQAGIVAAEPNYRIVPSAPAPAIPPPAPGVQRIKVGGNIQATKLINKAAPVYPPLAKAARISGIVTFTALIDREGNMAALQLISGHPLLVAAAKQAVMQWTCSPTLPNGQPAEVLTQIDVNFTLAQ
jgi:TonB family protein